jgi:wobble nucleotide-excising tRNase
MLQRIISIKNVERFKSYTALGDVTFRRFTLIFAENARGKTTLCARTTLGSMDRLEVQLLTANGNIAFRNGVWNAAFPAKPLAGRQ